MGRRGVTLLLLGALMVVVPAANATDASMPAYLTPYSADFALNSHWNGAHVVTAIPTSTLPNVPHDPAKWVWANACGKTQQSVAFTRTVELLGPPTQDSTFYWINGTEAYQGDLSRWTSLKSLQLEINHEHAYGWKSGEGNDTNISLTPRMRSLFRPGANDIEIRATRAALPRGYKSCNHKGQQPLIGLTARFTLYFTADLRPGIPTENPAFRHGTSAVTNQFVLNLGPDRAINGYLSIFYGGQGTIQAVSQGGKAQVCPLEPGGWVCRFSQLDPGQRLNVLVGLTWTPPPGTWDHDIETIDFTAYWPGLDPNSSNNTVRQTIVFCQQGSTYPGC